MELQTAPLLGGNYHLLIYEEAAWVVINSRFLSQPGRFESRLCIGLILFMMLDTLLNCSGLKYFVYEIEAIIVLTSRVVLGLNELMDF